MSIPPKDIEAILAIANLARKTLDCCENTYTQNQQHGKIGGAKAQAKKHHKKELVLEGKTYIAIDIQEDKS